METNEPSETGKPAAARRGAPVWVRDEQMDGLRRIADGDGESVAFHVRRAIAAYLKKHDKPTLEVRA